jgi:hypothetical protein
MSARTAASLAVLFSLVSGLLGTGAPAAIAGADVCPEPNDQLATACFLGPDGQAPGFIDTPDDVDGYRIELPADSMILATLGGLPADYSLRLLTSDASVKAEATQPGLADKVVKADGLPAGTYYLAIFSQRGESNPDAPYLISVSYPASLALSNPTAPAAPAGAPQGAYGYVPAPARAYGLTLSDVGEGFREVQRDESEDGRVLTQRLLARDAFACPNITPATACSRSGAGMIDTVILLLPYGTNDELAAEYDKALGGWRSKGWNVEPTVGWGSEQVNSFAQAAGGIMVRGIALKHRNALVLMLMTGFEQHATWDAIAKTMRVIESRIWAAVQ